MIFRMFTLLALVGVVLAPWQVAALAGEADVVAVEATHASNGTWRFDVTLSHGDEGWEHYANAWEVVAPDGSVIATRILQHPHVHEQPFTRSLSGVRIPDGVSFVSLRAVDSVHGRGGKEVKVTLDGQ